MSEQRFYRDGRKVLDREKSSHGTVYCEARSGHAAEVIQRALNSWAGMGASKPTKLAAADFQAERRLKRKYRPKLELWDELVEALEALAAMDGLMDKLWKAVPWGQTFNLPLRELNEVPMQARRVLNRAKQVEGSK